MWFLLKWSNKLVVLPLVVATNARHCWHRTRVRSTSSFMVPKRKFIWNYFDYKSSFLWFSLVRFSFFNVDSLCAGAWSASAHWWRTNVIGGIAVHAGSACRDCTVCMHSVSGTLEIRWVNLRPTWQALQCDYSPPHASQWQCSNDISCSPTPQSPDLNPIEIVWDEMDYRV